MAFGWSIQNQPCQQLHKELLQLWFKPPQTTNNNKSLLPLNFPCQTFWFPWQEIRYSNEIVVNILLLNKDFSCSSFLFSYQLTSCSVLKRILAWEFITWECIKANLATKVQSLGPTWGKKKRDSLIKLSDLNMCSMTGSTSLSPSFPPSLSVCLSVSFSPQCIHK